MLDYRALRKRMVEEQLLLRGIKNPKVLDAFCRVERHRFVPAAYATNSYADYPLPIGQGQTISQPYIVALMTECLGVSSWQRVLEIGTGSGYQTAILAELVKEVYSIERLDELARKAEHAFAGLGYKNIKLKGGDGSLGWEEFAPFERIIVTAAAPRIPKALTAQLSDGGRLVLPLGEGLSQVLTVVTKKKDRLESEEICGCVFVPLVGEYGLNDKHV